MLQYATKNWQWQNIHLILRRAQHLILTEIVYLYKPIALNMSAVDKRSHEYVSTSVHISSPFFFAMISNCMEMFSDNEDSKVFLVFAVLTYLTYPLQGLYNLVVFIYPKFRRIKEANQDISVFCSFCIAIRYYDRPRGRRSSITFTTFNRVQASEIIITENEQSELNADNNGIDALTG